MFEQKGMFSWTGSFISFYCLVRRVPFLILGFFPPRQFFLIAISSYAAKWVYTNIEIWNYCSMQALLACAGLCEQPQTPLQKKTVAPYIRTCCIICVYWYAYPIAVHPATVPFGLCMLFGAFLLFYASTHHSRINLEGNFSTSWDAMQLEATMQVHIIQ